MTKINGAELIAALPVWNANKAEIERFYVVLDRGDEYVTTWVQELDDAAEWMGSGRYTTSLPGAIANMIKLATECEQSISGTY